jgi:hypothetical protein
MTVEIRMLPPPQNEEADATAIQEMSDSVQQIQEQLIFPTPTGAPVLELVHMPKREGSDDNGGKTARAAPTAARGSAPPADEPTPDE